MHKNEEFIWQYNNYFEKDKFLKPIDCLDWTVINSNNFSSHYLFSERKFEDSYNLSEGDIFKLGTILFLVRKIKIKENKSNTNNSMNNSININMNIENNNINLEYRYNKKENSENALESSKTIKENKNKSKNVFYYNNGNNIKISNSINNKLKNIYLKLKNINEKNKMKSLKCRICFSEGYFEGKNPLISPCNCIGSLKYIHLDCLRKWLTSKINLKISSSNNIYYYSFKHLECEICKSIIPEQVEYRGKIISLLDFKDIEPPYIILQAINQYNPQEKNIEYNAIFLISFKERENIIIGRANNSDIRLNDISVSRNHSIISYNNGNFYIDDIGSKYGTLLLIQNNILFLPYKEINIQTGKCHLTFYLARTCLGFFRCYKNKLFDKLTYNKYFNSQEKIVYSQMMEDLINNIVDPIEKYNSLFNSYISDIENSNNDNNTEKGKIKDDINLNSNKIVINNNNYNEDKNPNLKLNDIQNKINNVKLNNTGSFIINRLTNSLISENGCYNLCNNSQKQNESNEMLFQEINNSNILNSKKINKNNYWTNFSIMNILKNRKKKTISIVNKKYNIFNKNLFTYSLNDKKNNNNILPNSQRNNKKILIDDS